MESPYAPPFAQETRGGRIETFGVTVRKMTPEQLGKASALATRKRLD